MPSPCTHVTVWSAHTPLALFERNPALQHALQPSDHQHASRYGTETRQNLFLTGRAMLRTMLSSLHPCPTACWSFHNEEAGKPQLQPAAGQPMLHFNVSHCPDLLVIAASVEGPVGIDVVDVQEVPGDPRAIRLICSPQEQQTIRLDHQMRDDLARIWACKEAYLKALGVGLRIPMTRVTCHHNPQRTHHPIGVDGQATRNDPLYSCMHARLDPQHHLALASQGENWTWNLIPETQWRAKQEQAIGEKA